MPVPQLSDRLLLRERPAAPVIMHQRWEHLLFLHWRWDPADIQRTLPPGLTVDTFAGEAWLAIVPFYMRGIRPRFCPPMPGLSNFLELNVRTYVHDEQGRAGVWFYSLDCNCRPAVWAARTFFHLSYHHAAMSAVRNDDGQVNYASRRRADISAASALYEWQLASGTREAEPGTLDFFLAERYLLFSHGPRGLYCGRVHHTPYPLSDVTVTRWNPRPLVLNGFAAPDRPPDHLIGSPGVTVTVYPLIRA